MAQRLGEELADGRGLVDLVAGTDTYRDLPHLVEQRRGQRRGTLVSTEVDATHTYAIERRAAASVGTVAFLTIQQGCDKFCTFCIVPFTRGRERSKRCADVMRKRGVSWTAARSTHAFWPEREPYRDGDVDFAGLLRRLDAIEGLERLHFTSSYPRDMTEDVLRAIAEGRAPIAFLHFPVQSGSDRVLKRMKRRHTVDWYMRRVDDARRLIPDLQMSTDLIVGFPGETEDFHAELWNGALCRMFMYRYSPREGTPATRLLDALPEEEKSRRLDELIRLQRRIGREILRENLGRTMEVLVEGPSSKDPSESFGRTRNRFMVVLPEGAALPGDLLPVKLASLSGSTYRGSRWKRGEHGLPEAGPCGARRGGGGRCDLRRRAEPAREGHDRPALRSAVRRRAARLGALRRVPRRRPERLRDRAPLDRGAAVQAP
jgi:tRNA-2-methylthio-N6-dimethylallyladenosine synthase